MYNVQLRKDMVYTEGYPTYATIINKLKGVQDRYGNFSYKGKSEEKGSPDIKTRNYNK